MTTQETDTSHLLPTSLKDLPTDLPQEISAHASSPKQSTPSQAQQPHYKHSVKTLLSWQAPGRPFRHRPKEYFMRVLLITFFVLVILFLFSQYLLMIVTLSVVFLSFSLASVPPYDFHYRISTEGITIEDHMFLWEELYDFYFKKIDTITVLHIRTRTLIPGELLITLGQIDEDHIKSVLLSYLSFREVVRLTFMEKAAHWLSSTFPLDNLSKES